MRRLRIDVPHALFLCAIAGYCIWYFFDARSASSDIQNLGLIAPVTLVVVILCGLGLRETVHLQGKDPAAPARPPLQAAFAWRIFGSMVLLGIYVLTMDRIGFDVATWLYVLANLLFLGERRIWLLVLVPLAFSAVMSIAFSTVLQTPIPLLFGPAE